ncbi:FecCD family ABC transporter permease [Rariglobus hedericola]|uniref:Iron ABC transporter permease n=1 Tax=Rariglobus hedericola TaxID=2597822 RepID=A0A556QKC4_9BACT|nr:iron ABC transporter permease [Rariglobus hedericola]TSJ77079.1 iron ABC transporter permease [Rariglobus hedericola]
MTRRGEQRWVLPALGAVLIVLVFVSLGWGELEFSWAQLWAGLTGADELARTVLLDLRLPRVITGVLTGAALAAGGLIMQAYFRNSLASPDLLGVSSGAAAGAVSAIVWGWTLAGLWVLPLTAVAGAVVATLAVLVLAKRGASSERLLLAGVALNALLGAVTSYQLSHGVALWERNAQLLFWLLGGLEDRSWLHVLAALPILVAAAVLWPLGRQMDLLSLGETEAQSLGVDVKRLRRVLLALATVLAATATSVAGIVGFVGLVVPHGLRLIVGPEHRRLVPLCLVGGAVFVLGCDLVGRLGGGLRLGIVTALIGGPFFLWLLRRRA